MLQRLPILKIITLSLFIGSGMLCAMEHQILSCKQCWHPGMDTLKPHPLSTVLPVHKAAEQGHLTCVENLCFYEPKCLTAPDKYGFQALHYAALNGKVDIIKFLIAQGVNKNTRTANGKTALHLTCCWFPECIGVLLEAGADPNVQDETKETPLHRTAIGGFDLSLALLLNYQTTDPNLADKNGNTALHLACLYNKIACVMALISRGAHTELKNNNEKTPLAIAEACGYAEIVDLFKKMVPS